MELRDYLLMQLDEMVQEIYEKTGLDYKELPGAEKEIVDQLHRVEALVSTRL